MKAIFFRLTILTLIPLIFNTPTLAQLYELEFTVSDDLRQCGSSADNAVDLKFTNRSGGSLNGNFTLDFSLQSPGASQVSINPSSITFSLNNLANNDFIVFTSLFSFLITCNYNLDPVSNASFHCQAGLLFDNGTSTIQKLNK